MPEKNYWHVRIRNPDEFDKDSFRIIEFKEGIKATIGCPKGEWKNGKCRVGTKVQKIMFDKSKFSKKEVIEWLMKHRIRKKRK